METMLRLGKDQVWVEDSGGEGPGVVLLHPGIHDSTVWDPVLPYTGGLRVVRFDRRDFGRSPMATEDYRTLDDLVAVLDALGLERAHLVGNSMGGEAALAAALEHPGRVASLTLIATGVTGYPWRPNPELEAEYGRLVDAADFEGMVDLAARIWCAAGVDEDLRAQLRASNRIEPNQLRHVLPNPEQWSRVPTLAMPVTVVAGMLDNEGTTEATLAIGASAPNAEAVVLDRSDHLPSLRAPVEVAKAIRNSVERGIAAA